MSVGAEQGERDDRQPGDGRDAEQHGEDAEQRDEDEHDDAGMVADRMAGQPDGDEDRADAGRGAQQAEAPRAEFQNVARIDRQQRHGAGRAARRTGRARSRRAPPSRPRCSGSRRTACPASASRRVLRWAGLGMEKTSSAGRRHQHRRGAVGDLGREAVEQAAGDRADDGRRLPCGRIPGHRVGEILRRHQIGDQRGRGRAEEGAGDAEDRQHGEDRRRARPGRAS